MARHLPDEFEFANRLAFLTYHLLQDHIVAGEKAGLLSFEVPIGPDEASKIAGLEGEAFWEWCRANGREEILAEYAYRHLIFALLTDFCQFTYEALSCSEKAKLTVAYALLRKPLQDNLFFLEWLLADREDFLQKFRDGPEHFDMGRMAKDLSKTRRIDIIGRAMDKTAAGRWMPAESLYDFRYAKDSEESLDRLFNRALHLVTTCRHYATEPENINFIFSDDEVRHELWSYLYLLLPSILQHTLYVVRELFKSINPDFEPFDQVAQTWLSVGFFLLSEQSGDEDQKNAAGEFFKNLFEEDPIACPECGDLVGLDTPNMTLFWDTGRVECRKCGLDVTLLELEDLIGEDLDDGGDEGDLDDQGPAT